MARKYKPTSTELAEFKKPKGIKKLFARKPADDDVQPLDEDDDEARRRRPAVLAQPAG